MGYKLSGKPTPRMQNSKHISTFPTTGSASTSSHRLFPLISLNPFAPAFLPLSSSDPPISLCKCNSSTMSLPLTQIFCGIPPQIVPPHAPSVNQHITVSTFLLTFLQQTNQSKPNAAAHQPSPEPSAPLSSPPQHQAKCLQAIQKTIQQFNQHLKAQHLNRQTLQLIVLQLQIDFALLRCLLFRNKDETVKNSHQSSNLP